MKTSFFKNISLRTSLTLGITLVGGLAVLLALYVEETYENIALSSQSRAYGEILRLRVGDRLTELKDISRKFGHSINNDKNFREDLKKGDVEKTQTYLRTHFHQYFVTAGIIKVNSLIAYDKKFEFLALAMDMENPAENGGRSCPSLIKRARIREGVNRMKTISELCVDGAHPFMHVLIPVGGLRVIGYLEVITDPVFSLAKIENDIGLPLKISLVDSSVSYESWHWNDGTEDQKSLLASYSPMTSMGKKALTLTSKQNLAIYIEKLNNTRNKAMVFVLLTTALFVFGVLFFVQKSTIKPLSNLASHIRKIQRDSSLLGERILPTGNKEIIELANGFNEMAIELSTLYGELTHANYELTAEVGEREHAEIELKNHRDHLEELVAQRTADLAIARDAALRASQSKSLFLANMSHELRTPLNAIIGYSEILMEDLDNVDVNLLKADLGKIHSAGRHLLLLIKDVLDLSKIESGKMELDIEEFDVKDLIFDVVSTTRPIVEKNANQFDVEIGKNVGKMISDSTKLRQALMNLLSNAGKFTKNGKISLNVETKLVLEGEQLMFSVTDNGIGLTEEQRNNIFQAFSQADTSTTRKYGGTGLGLAISRNFCQMMGGDIILESVVGVGSTFSIILPVKASEMSSISDFASFTSLTFSHNDPVQVRLNKLNTAGSHERRNYISTILVIDDDMATNELVVRYLTKNGFKTTSAKTGEDGLRLAYEIKPDVVLLDVLMSGMDGWTVLKKMKQDAELIDIPVIMMSILEDKNMGFSLGAAEYLTKPIDKTRLYRAVHKCSRKKSTGPILVVEENMVLRQNIVSILRDDGWSVIEAETSIEAVECIKQQIPALIVLDPSLAAKEDGFDLVDEIKHFKEWSEIPLLVLAANPVSEKDEARLSGAVYKIIDKNNFSPDNMMEEIVKALTVA